MGITQSQNTPNQNTYIQNIALATGNCIINPDAFDRNMNELARTTNLEEYVNQTWVMVKDGLGELVWYYWHKYHPNAQLSQVDAVYFRRIRLERR